MKCKTCKFYNKSEEFHSNTENWFLAPCILYGLLVPRTERACSDYEQATVVKKQTRSHPYLTITDKSRIKRLIKSLIGTMSQKAIAQQMGISQALVSRVNSGQLWSDAR